MNDIDFSVIDSELKAYLIGFFYAENEIDAQKFLQEIKNKIKTYEKFISEMVK